jgi:hypothetical protein
MGFGDGESEAAISGPKQTLVLAVELSPGSGLSLIGSDHRDFFESSMQLELENLKFYYWREALSEK